ncbi:MAG: phosphate permease [Candidatus Peregrinibacteria bacterium GW2011_GWE2_39_6]|nr:MAG: phosphate permease [Candidatus Peregrinibacteria bacterium GW2011_GWF2_39_17]KKR24307.1 MAG: phosphate permease [Candidatus Peregrinibacteria bacterium GW2011_GWE2_39_6]HCW31915.1 hypothetical protein [Candidatus Peregrinibacteria bacterium]
MAIFEWLAIVCLVCLAFGDLMVGVANDAVNFVNSAIGAKVASRKVIMLVASIGVIIGATFSDGIIEVARKGIFNPEFFTLQEAIILFTAAAMADLILLDLFSTFGLPTSTTVSIVFEIFGAAFILALLKLGNLDQAWETINSASAIKIITGIFLSIGVAFIVAIIVQFITRLLFTFDYHSRLKKWGFLWSGVALTCLFYFILVVGGKHATFMTEGTKGWIEGNLNMLLGSSLVVLSVISYTLIHRGVNILKIIVLIGTGGLAMAFAGNDLANFIGVSVGGVHAFLGADLSGTLPTPTWVLILAGFVMAFSIFTSKKAKTVTSTEVNLASHKKSVTQQWKSNGFVEHLTRLILFLYRGILRIFPKALLQTIKSRWTGTERNHLEETHSDFDLLRAAVNLMVSAVLISFATAHKLPLSTTYVTFMVAMGTALTDGAWDRECAPHRIHGVLTVVSGWFITAFMAFLIAGVAVSILYLFQMYGLLFLIVVTIVIIYKLYHLHEKRSVARVGNQG